MSLARWEYWFWLGPGIVTTVGPPTSESVPRYELKYTSEIRDTLTGAGYHLPAVGS